MLKNIESLHRKCLLQLMYLCLEINLIIQTFPFTNTLTMYRMYDNITPNHYVIVCDSFLIINHIFITI